MKKFLWSRKNLAKIQTDKVTNLFWICLLNRKAEDHWRAYLLHASRNRNRLWMCLTRKFIKSKLSQPTKWKRSMKTKNMFQRHSMFQCWLLKIRSQPVRQLTKMIASSWARLKASRKWRKKGHQQLLVNSTLNQVIWGSEGLGQGIAWLPMILTSWMLLKKPVNSPPDALHQNRLIDTRKAVTNMIASR